MNTRFKSALNKIQVEDELLENTEKYLREKLDNRQNEKIVYLNKGSVKQRKKLLVASVAAVFIIGALVGGYAFLNTPVAYMSIDINPSIELGINAFNRVVTAEGLNQDGQTVLEGQNIINRNLSKALELIINSAAEKKYIEDDGTSVISITVESNNKNKADDLSDVGERAVNSSMDRKRIAAIIYKNCSDLSLRREAKELGISPGKFKLIKRLQALDPSITVEDYKYAKVAEILQKLRELIDAADTDDPNLSKRKEEAIKALEDVLKRLEIAKERQAKLEEKKQNREREAAETQNECTDKRERKTEVQDGNIPRNKKRDNQDKALENNTDKQVKERETKETAKEQNNSVNAEDESTESKVSRNSDDKKDADNDSADITKKAKTANTNPFGQNEKTENKINQKN